MHAAQAQSQQPTSHRVNANTMNREFQTALAGPVMPSYVTFPMGSFGQVYQGNMLIPGQNVILRMGYQGVQAFPANTEKGTNIAQTLQGKLDKEAKQEIAAIGLSRERCADLLLSISQNKKPDAKPAATTPPKVKRKRASKFGAPGKKRKYPRDVPNIPSPIFKKDRLEPYNLGPVPDFILDELETTSGTGQFTRAELMVTLLFAHQLLSQRDAGNGESIRRGNTYAIIKSRMGDRRSRASIRRKIEKIVSKDTGIPGGLLKEDFRVNMALNSIWKRLLKLIVLAEKTGTPKQVVFSRKLRKYANKYVADSKNEFIRQGLVVSSIKPPEEYTSEGVAAL